MMGEKEVSESEDSLAMLKCLDRDEILEVLGKGLCNHCDSELKTRIQTLAGKKLEKMAISDSLSPSNLAHSSSTANTCTNKSLYSSIAKSNGDSKHTPKSTFSTRDSKVNSFLSPKSVTSKYAEQNVSRATGLTTGSGNLDELSGDAEQVRISQIKRKKDFIYMETFKGKSVNVLQGLELHTGVFNSHEQKDIVDCVMSLQRMGQSRLLKERTYTEPKKWMRGKGRATIQFGCCYNYATDKNGNPPGIVRDEEVDPLPILFKQMIKRMVRWHVLPSSCVPDSCIVNIYDEGDCIPPHIDHHDFIRPFCTVSFLTECNILFGSNLQVVSAGEFSGPVSISLPLGSVLILNGNGADVAKHCVPSVPAKRISITFRKMDKNKVPYRHRDDSELVGIKPFGGLSDRAKITSYNNTQQMKKVEGGLNNEGFDESSNNKFVSLKEDEFPPLHKMGLGSKQRKK